MPYQLTNPLTEWLTAGRHVRHPERKVPGQSHIEFPPPFADFAGLRGNVCGHCADTLDWNAQRLAVLDHDIDAIIRTHAKDRKVAAWLEDTAEAFEEIAEIDLAIDWAKQATDFDRGHQSLEAADYWCKFLDEHRPDKSLEARLLVFRNWPSSTTAARLHKAAGTSWPDYRDEVVATLASSPSDAVLFALLTLEDVQFAWSLAHSLALDSDQTWSELLKSYEKVDPLAVLPIHQRLVENELVDAGAQHYRLAARRLAKMRKLAAEVGALIAALRETHRRRPRVQQEFRPRRTAISHEGGVSAFTSRGLGSTLWRELRAGGCSG